MNRFEICALCAALFLTGANATAISSAWEIYVVWTKISPQMTALAVLGWLICTYGALVIALLCWRLSKRVRWPWALHLLVLPGAFFSLREGARIMLYATESFDFDSTLGAPVMTGFFLSLVAILLYVAALLSRGWLGPKGATEA